MSSTITAFHDLAEVEAAVGKGPYLSDVVTITQAMIDDFAKVTLDPQWIHVDPERARRESPYGTTIAHGFLSLSLISHFIETAVSFPTAKMGINYGLDKVRFVSAVPAGSELQAAFTLAEVKAANPGLQLTWNVEVRAKDAPKPAVAAVWLSRIVL